MSDRVLLIESPAEVSVDLGRIRIRRSGQPDVHALASDIAVLVLHHHAVSISVSALRSLAEEGAIVLVTDEKHLPCAQSVPSRASRETPSRLRAQMAFDGSEASHGAWADIVRSRILTQAATLKALGRRGALRLVRMAKEVESGDRTHREGQAARHYWKHLFDDFRREKHDADEPRNARLNYGYAVLRSLVARELALAGLSCELGLGHRSNENPFNLADDFMEPYRFLVERMVHGSELDAPFDGKARAGLLRFLESEVRLGSRSFRVASAVRSTVQSYCRLLESPQTRLELPSG